MYFVSDLQTGYFYIARPLSQVNSDAKRRDDSHPITTFSLLVEVCLENSAR
jgi:hypothetical protein